MTRVLESMLSVAQRIAQFRYQIVFNATGWTFYSFFLNWVEITTCIDFHSGNKMYIRFDIRVCVCHLNVLLFYFFLFLFVFWTLMCAPSSIEYRTPNTCHFVEHSFPVKYPNVYRQCMYMWICAGINYMVLCKSQSNITVLCWKFGSQFISRDDKIRMESTLTDGVYCDQNNWRTIRISFLFGVQVQN